METTAPGSLRRRWELGGAISSTWGFLLLGDYFDDRLLVLAFRQRSAESFFQSYLVISADVLQILVRSIRNDDIDSSWGANLGKIRDTDLTLVDGNNHFPGA